MKHKWLVLGISCLLLGLAGWYAHESRKIRPLSEETSDWLYATEIQDFEANHLTVEQLIQRVNQALASDPRSDGLRVRIWPDERPPREFRKRLGPPEETPAPIPGLEPIPGASAPTPQDVAVFDGNQISLERGNISYGLLLRCATVYGHSILGQSGRVIYLIKGNGSLEPIKKRSYTRSMSFWRSISFPEKRSALTPEDLVRALDTTSYEGSSATLNDAGTLTVTNIESELDHIDSLLAGHDRTVAERISDWFSAWRHQH
jgi:hypothetical protein